MQFLKVCRSNNFDKIQQWVNKLIRDGYSGVQVLSQLNEMIIKCNKDELTDVQKSRICMEIASAEKCLMDGASEDMQLLSVASFVMRLLSK